MNLHKKMAFKIVIALVISFAVVYTLYGLYALCTSMKEVKKDVEQRQARLLYETDHQALLEACREISRMVARADLKKHHYKIRKNPDPETSRFPQLILDLNPSYVYIDENDSGRVMVEMHGGLHHFGVQAYTEDYKKPFPSFEYGDKELIDGLWYYDDGYLDNPEYDKVIDELIEKHKGK